MVIFGPRVGPGPSRHTQSDPDMYDTPYDIRDQLVRHPMSCFHETAIGDVPMKFFGMGPATITSSFQLMGNDHLIIRVSNPGVLDSKQ